MRRPAGAQLELPFEAPVRLGRHETPAIHAAIQALRAAGRRVYRCGKLHQVDGRLLDTAELMRLAAALPADDPEDEK